MMEHNALARNFNTASLLRFAMPNIIMMIFMSLYTIVDGMFITRYAGELALSATNMFYPFMSFQLGISIMLGSGGSAIIAWKLGRKEEGEAREDFTCIVSAALLFGIITAVIGILFMDQLLDILGTSEL